MPKISAKTRRSDFYDLWIRTGFHKMAGSDGSVLAVGKGNPDWNYSAPHGAGRIMSRMQAKAQLSLDEYKQSMDGIYTTSISQSTLDEAPMAYKSLDDIISVIGDAVEIIDVMKPVYNFKAAE